MDFERALMRSYGRAMAFKHESVVFRISSGASRWRFVRRFCRVGSGSKVDDVY